MKEKILEKKMDKYRHDQPDDIILKRQERFREHWLKIQGGIGNLKFYCNPLTAIGSFVLVWALVIWAFTDNDSHQLLQSAKQWITDVWTWLYIADQFIWTGFVVFIYFKWGHLKLGKDDDLPNYDDLSYFAMVFCTGLSAAKYYAGVTEPIDHYTYKGSEDILTYWGKNSSMQQAQNAINITLFHWGIHGFAIYTLPAILLSFMAYRKGLPITMRTTLYPLLGKKIEGRAGDLIDFVSIIDILFGVSVGLAIGANILNSGLHESFSNFDVVSGNQIVIIWSLTAIATASVLSGLNMGIRHLSVISLVAGTCVFLVIIAIEDTWYILNLFVQSVGYYLQFLIGTGLYTGAFSQTGNLPNQNPESKNWIHKNTLFYWGWWIAVAPMTATFIARISRGRKISELILYCCFLPVLCLFLWMTAFGGIAINMQHLAINGNITCDMYNNGKRNINYTVWTNQYKNIDNLECLDESARFFAIIDKYDGVATLLYIFSMLSMVLQYATHADSASLVVDIISSNGKDNPPIMQRVLWTLTQGAVATALIKYSEQTTAEKTIDSISPISIIVALPMIIILNCSCVALWRVLSNERGFNLDTEFVEWHMYYGNINKVSLWKDTLIALLCPWLIMGDIRFNLNEDKKWQYKIWAYFSFGLLFYLWIILLIVGAFVDNLDKFGWISLLGFFVYSAYYRQILRRRRHIAGNIIEDVIVMVIYPLTILQMHEELHVEPQSDAPHLPPDEEDQFEPGSPSSGYNKPDFSPPVVKLEMDDIIEEKSEERSNRAGAHNNGYAESTLSF